MEMTEPVRDDAILPLTRWVAWFILLDLLGAFVILYGISAETERLWAWTIRPRMTAITMGASYAAGAYFFVRVATGSHWHRVAGGFLPVTLFTALVPLATLLHWDRFNHDHPAFFVWLGV